MDPVAILGTAASMGGSILGYMGQQEANRTNVQMNDSTNQWNTAEAKKNRDWQEYMSNTAKRRERHDLEEAGLNPILAANGGASTPSGGAPTLTAGRVENEVPSNIISGAITSAMEAKRLGMAMEQNEAIINKAVAETRESKMRTIVMSKDIPKADLINKAYDGAKWLLEKIKSPDAYSPKTNHNLNDYQNYYKNLEKQKPIQLRSN